MRVLAVDPGYDRCGVAVVDKKDGKETVIFSSCIETDKKSSFAERLHAVGLVLDSLFSTHHPTTCALERLYFTNNQKTAMGVSEVRGVVQFIAASHRVPVYEYTPGEVKVAVTGSGAATKKQVMQMVPKLVFLPRPVLRDDEFDAIAIGLTHLASPRTHTS